jgi:membrane protein YdbS with pleckstrin-like domain
LTKAFHAQSWKYIPKEVQDNMKQDKKDRLGLTAGNYWLLLAAIVMITAGYFIMSADEISISPLLLVIAYVVVIPVALLIRFKKKD